jgi:hypothetical protein
MRIAHPICVLTVDGSLKDAVVYRGSEGMNELKEFAVTLDPELYERLRKEADALGVTIQWVVASLICDTLRLASN